MPEIPNKTTIRLAQSSRLHRPKDRELDSGMPTESIRGAPHGLVFTHIERLNAALLSFLTA
jgi:hypothetical protein